MGRGSRLVSVPQEGPRAMTTPIEAPPTPASMPWQDRPAGHVGPLWRSSLNPVIPRDLLPRSNSIFNSAVVPFEGGLCRRLPGR